MVVTDNSEITAGNGKQHEASVLLNLSKEELKEDPVEVNGSEKPTVTPPLQTDFCNSEVKNKRKSEVPHSLELPPTPTLTSSPFSCSDNSPASSPCVSSYFDVYQNFNSCSTESNSSNSPTDDPPNTPPLSPPGSPSIIDSPLSPLSPLSPRLPESLDLIVKNSESPYSSLSACSSLSLTEQPRRPRQVSFNHTVTFIPHIPPPPNKIRKKLTKEASARQKDLILEVEDLGKVRLDGKNGRVIKIVPNVFPGPLNGEYGQCDVMLKDSITMEISHSKNQNNSEDEDDDDVLYITAVPIVEKDKKLRLGKHFRRYYNKLVQ